MNQFRAPSLSTRLTTDRLVLRPPRTTDLTELRRHLRMNADHLRPWSPASPQGEDPMSLASLSKSLLIHRREWKRGDAFVFLIAPKTDAEVLIGRIAFQGVTRGAFLSAYMSYWIDSLQQSKGLMTESAEAALSFAFQAGGLHRVQAAVMPINTRSIRVVEKLGFRNEGLAERYLRIAGEWCDHLIYAITAEEWIARNSGGDPSTV